MTAVTQTEAFSKLDEGTVKDFITKVPLVITLENSLKGLLTTRITRSSMFHNYSLINYLGGAERSLQVLMFIQDRMTDS